MSKKKSNKGAAFADQLASQLESGKPGDLAKEAKGLTAGQFDEAFTRALELLQKGPDPRDVANLPGSFQIAFLKLAEAEEDDDQVNDLLSMTGDKDVKKEAKRVLHRLRSRGLDVEAADEAGPSILDRRVAEDNPELPCYLTPVTSLGTRMVWLASYVRGGVGVYQVEISDEEGLNEFEGGVIGRSRYRVLAKDILKNEQVAMLEISYGEARQRIAGAVSRSREASRALPDGYLEASTTLPDPKESVSLSDPRKEFPLDSLDDFDKLVASSVELHEAAYFSDWMPDEDTIKGFHEKLKEIETSQVTINEQQRVDQINKAMDQAVESQLEGEEKRNRYQNRLFEMAAFLGKIGEDEPARQSAAAAWQLGQEEFEPLQSPFFDRLVKKMFRSPEEIVKQMAGPGGEAADAQPEGEKPPPDAGNLIVPP